MRFSFSTTKPAVPSLQAPVSRLRGVGQRNSVKLQRLGIQRIADLLFHLPYRYSDRTRVTPIGALQPGREAVVEGTIELTQVRFGRRRSLLSVLSDGTGRFTLRFFHFSSSQQAGLERGTRLRCFGTVRPGPQMLEMVHPEYQRIQADSTPEVAATLTPIYPTTEGINQTTLRRLTGEAIRCLQKNPAGLPELLPDELLHEHHFPELAAALQYVHQPPADADLDLLEAGLHPAQRRLAFEELLAMHLGQRQRRARLQNIPAPVLGRRTDLVNRLFARLPFTATGAQQRVMTEIEQDLNSGRPMLRLLQGDVGAGKTLVAAAAALLAIDNDWQVAIMAPTELLAEQHYRNFHDWLAPIGLQPWLLTGKLRGSERERCMQALRSNTAGIVIGTHALFQADIKFSRLDLVIIDEQHRFGVHQRLALLEKGSSGETGPHQLIMTATPIPRTLAMALHADLDVSIIDELPPGRQPVNTVVLADSRREELIERIAAACHDQRQVYWVCPLIDESELLQCQAATETSEILAQQLPDVRVGLLHGRLPAKEKSTVMQSFKGGEIDLLVATTVIEVGVDVPNASLMIIENAERMGLAQLHQLRGRVGRGSRRSDCVLLYKAPLGELARARLEVMRASSDGFEIAQRDLELRGPGELLGTRQTGLPSLRIADFSRDLDLIPLLPAAGDCILRSCPQRVDELVARWQDTAQEYGQV
jgi:ATP-dependent DNA helicase RecG